MIDKRKEFLTKLANLLDEYNTDIKFTCSEGSILAAYTMIAL